LLITTGKSTVHLNVVLHEQLRTEC
jgi:hypothetical protein